MVTIRLGESTHPVGEGERVGKLGKWKARSSRAMPARSSSSRSGASRLSSAISVSVTRGESRRQATQRSADSVLITPTSPGVVRLGLGSHRSDGGARTATLHLLSRLQPAHRGERRRASGDTLNTTPAPPSAGIMPMEAGDAKLPSICGYADDSITNRVAACAVALFAAEHVPAAEAIVAAHLSRLGLPPEVRIHCRELFHAEARAKTAWSSIHASEIEAMLELLCASLKALPHHPLIVIADVTQRRKGWTMPDGRSWTFDEKGIATFAYQVAFSLIGHTYRDATVRLWIDPDKTRIPWGGGRRQTEKVRRVYVDLGQGLEPHELVPDIVDAPKPILLDVADVYAYTAARVKGSTGGRQNQWFEALYRLIGAQEAVAPPLPETLTWHQKPSESGTVDRASGDDGGGRAYSAGTTDAEE
jgi:hypothetical protein